MANTQNDPSSNQSARVRYAVVGLGDFAQSNALPAFSHTENSELVALVSSDATKLAELAKKYSVPYTHTYEEYDDLLMSGNVDAVYIALPNHLHYEYTIKAAKAGVNILCEKPMAITVEDCTAMIKAAQEHNVKLMIAYRLHLEAANLQAIEIAKSGQIGDLRTFNSLFTQQTLEGDIRLQSKIGGGTLEDIGIYCINAARHLLQAEPIAVFATSANNGEPRFREVAEMTSVILRFPYERLATFTCSFGAARVDFYQIVGTKGDLHVDRAYSTKDAIKHTITIDGKSQEQTFTPQDQLAAEFVYFSQCILQNVEPEPSGQEGLIDVKIINALHQSMLTGDFVAIEGLIDLSKGRE
jgi:predicted dehydrogenase